MELARVVGAQCRRAGLTLATAESCTGGLIGHVLTEVPGSSDYYVGGIISYADRVKAAQLAVPVEVLEEHGAVSAEAALAMAAGVRRALGSDIGVAVTGIAGPSGGLTAKPVGLTYVAVSDAAGAAVRRHLWTGDRASNKRDSAAAVFELLLERFGTGSA